jgi:SAM-dependent methyltransferase
MKGWKPSTYGDRAAESYDARFPKWGDEEGAVEFLAKLAGDGRALELGSGTGRIALQLAARGVRVSGVEASRRMVARMRAKKGGRRIPVAIGDMKDVPAAGPFALVYVVFNTFYGLTTQEDQVACFANVAARLSPGGAFVLEGFVPDVARFDRGQRTSALSVEADGVEFDVAIHDRAAQTIATNHVRIRGGRATTSPIFARYAWPSELDLMARLAGLRLRSRHAGWRGERFGSWSANHVSVWEKPR